MFSAAGRFAVMGIVTVGAFGTAQASAEEGGGGTGTTVSLWGYCNSGTCCDNNRGGFGGCLHGRCEIATQPADGYYIGAYVCCTSCLEC